MRLPGWDEDILMPQKYEYDSYGCHLLQKKSRRLIENSLPRDEGDIKNKIVLRIISIFRKGATKKDIRCNSKINI